MSEEEERARELCLVLTLTLEEAAIYQLVTDEPQWAGAISHAYNNQKHKPGGRRIQAQQCSFILKCLHKKGLVEPRGSYLPTSFTHWVRTFPHK